MQKVDIPLNESRLVTPDLKVKAIPVQPREEDGALVCKGCEFQKKFESIETCRTIESIPQCLGRYRKDRTSVKFLKVK